MLAGIDEVDWKSLRHAYGRATDTPRLIKSLYDAEKCGRAVDDLAASIQHQGMSCDATAVAAPFLAMVAADPAAPGRGGALNLLVNYSDSTRMCLLWMDRSSRRKARSALAECVPLLLPGLEDEDPWVRRKVAIFCDRVERLPADVIATLRNRMTVEGDTTVLCVLVSAVSSHGGMREAEIAQLEEVPDLARFAAARGTVMASSSTSGDLDTLAELWNTCQDDFEQVFDDDALEHLSVTGDLMARLDELGVGFVDWLTRLAQHGSQAAFDALRQLNKLVGTRRDLYPAVLDALLLLAATPIEGLDEQFRDSLDQLPVTPRNYLALAMVDAVPAAGARRAELLDTLGLVVNSSPVPRLVFRFAEHQETAHWASHFADRVRDIRVDALPALAGHPGSMEMLRATLADGTCHAYLLRKFVRGATADQVDELAEIVVEQLRRDEGFGDWLSFLAELPVETTRRRSEEVIALARVHDFHEFFSWDASKVLQMLLGWGTPAAAALVAEWVGENGKHSQWATLALGVLRYDADLVDAAFADGFPEYDGDKFLSLAAGLTTPGLLTACRTMLTGEADADGSGTRTKLACARIVAATDGLAAVWPTVIAVLRARCPLFADGVSTATDLLLRYPDDPAAAHCRTELVSTLVRVVSAKPSGSTRQNVPVVASDTLLDLGEPIPRTATRRAIGMLKTHARSGWFPDTLEAACRVLEAALPDLDEATRREAVGTLRALVESPVRIQNGPHAALELDERFTSLLRRLIEVVDQ